MSAQAPTPQALTIEAPSPPGAVEAVRRRYFGSLVQTLVTAI